MKVKKYSRANVIPRSSGLKPMARGLGCRSHSTVVKQAMRNPKMRIACLNVLEKDMQKDLTSVASMRKGLLCLRLNTLHALDSFSWEKLHDELKLIALTPFSVLHACVNVRRHKQAAKRGGKTHHPSNSALLGVCTAVLLQHHNHNLKLVQRIIP